jgi:tetratricopeptide (TPR) repeat protein
MSSYERKSFFNWPASALIILKKYRMQVETADQAAQIANAKIQEGKFSLAHEILVLGNERFPNHPAILRFLGVAKFHIGDDKGALQVLYKALEFNTTDVMVLSYLGATEFMVGKYTEALEHLNNALTIDPNHVFTLVKRGEVKRKLGELEDAIKDFDRAHELDPTDLFNLSFRGEGN